MDEKIWHKEACHQTQGAVFDVYREMGCGFLEAIYQECLEKEFFKRGIPFVAHQVLRLFCKGDLLKQTFIPDFICHEAIIIELKTLSAITSAHKAQLVNTLKATNKRLGLLVNLGCYPKASIERIVL